MVLPVVSNVKAHRTISSLLQSISSEMSVSKAPHVQHEKNHIIVEWYVCREYVYSDYIFHMINFDSSYNLFKQN